MGPVVRLLGSGIGLASEALAARKQKKDSRSSSPNPAGDTRTTLASGTEASKTRQHASQQSGVIEVTDDQADELVNSGQAVQIGHTEDKAPSGAPPGYGDLVDDEEDWELDEAGEKEGGFGDATEWNEDEKTEGKPDVRKILQKFLVAHPLPPHPANHAPLPCPVIIPQRRPRTKSRGFVEAYAPVLQGVGIDQATWMNFLETFHKASQASPVFGAILIAGHLIGFVPSVAAMVASTLIQAAAIGAVVAQSRSRTNTFLDDINQYFFRPRGLYVLLVTYHGERHKWSSEPLDISHAVTKSAHPADLESSGNHGAKLKHNLQWSSGSSHGGMEMPEAAPLIFPDLDKAVDQADQSSGSGGSSGGGAKQKFHSASKFVSEYSDRRAQAKFQNDSPEAALLVPQDKQFASRYSDPNHPASSGSLVSLLTGGNVDPRTRRSQRDQAKKDRRGFMGPLGMIRHYQPVRRVMRQGVLYMMVVNMPSEAEMASAMAEMEKQERQ